MSDEYKLNTLRTIPLLNGMVDAALVFGFDETCSRELEVEGEVRQDVHWVGGECRVFLEKARDKGGV